MESYRHCCIGLKGTLFNAWGTSIVFVRSTKFLNLFCLRGMLGKESQKAKLTRKPPLRLWLLAYVFKGRMLGCESDWCQQSGGIWCFLEPLPRCSGSMSGIPLWPEKALSHLSPCGWLYSWKEDLWPADFQAGHVRWAIFQAIPDMFLYQLLSYKRSRVWGRVRAWEYK